MKKIYLFLLVLLGFSGVINAQNDPNAKKVLDGVSNKLKTLKGVNANFSYTTKDRNNVAKGSVKGLISIKGQKYYIKQGTTEIFCNGAKVWNFNGEDEVTVADVDNEDNKTLSPQKLLTNFYDQDFTYKLVSSKGSFHEILMIPTDKRKNFKQVTIFIDKAKSLIAKANVVDKSDNTIGFTLSNIVTNIVLPDTKFMFDAAKHPGVEVVNQ
jgi:outer membrane lipoprotein-sorting protein